MSEKNINNSTAQQKEWISLAGRALLNGRLRRKITGSRSENFESQIEKRRAYFCCLSENIDIHKLHDYLLGDFFAASTWKFHIIGDTLLLHKIEALKSNFRDRNAPLKPDKSIIKTDNVDTEEDFIKTSHNKELDNPSKITQEIFIFDFGVAVFWGFEKGEEINLLKIIRMFAFGDILSDKDFEDGEDDMMFFVSPINNTLSIANNCVFFPDQTNAKQRLAVSYAIAQSSILSLMETRIENRMEEYEYMPLNLAEGKSVSLSQIVLRKMIGEVIMIRHEVNLHSDLLDIPDFFWTEEKYTSEYNIANMYLEMEGRIEILNKRLDLLKQLLEVMNLQIINLHGKYRTEIIIWIIVLYVVIELASQFLPFLGLYDLW
jgi:uncharacterized Rmd1/YagE family protein